MVGIYGKYEKECPNCKQEVKREYRGNVLTFGYWTKDKKLLEVAIEKCEHCNTEILFPIDEDELPIQKEDDMKLFHILH